MLLEALVACAGVTLRAVATSLGIDASSGRVSAEGDLDFRGTLGVDRDAPVGFTGDPARVRGSTATPTTSSSRRCCKLTERYCVVFQTLASGPALTTTLTAR